MNVFYWCFETDGKSPNKKDKTLNAASLVIISYDLHG